MVNGEQSESDRMIRLSLTFYCLPHALRSALGALHQGAVQSQVLWVRILYSLCQSKLPQGRRLSAITKSTER
jgi:hypothetical protein